MLAPLVSAAASVALAWALHKRLANEACLAHANNKKETLFQKQPPTQKVTVVGRWRGSGVGCALPVAQKVQHATLGLGVVAYGGRHEEAIEQLVVAQTNSQQRVATALQAQ